MAVEELKRALGERFHDIRTALPTKGEYEAIDSRAMKYIVIHHAEGHRTATPEFIANHHVKNLGWEGIGFHFLIRMGDVYYVGDVDTARADPVAAQECLGAPPLHPHAEGRDRCPIAPPPSGASRWRGWRSPSSRSRC